jgi:hypothetical protein
MSLRGILALLLAVAVAGTLGLYWNQSAFKQVLRDGYDTRGQIISAEVTAHRFPFVFDGWWPRFVDESLSIELRWTGRDGVERTRRGVAVSDAFAARITSGTQVKLIEIPVRVIDDDSSLPAVIDDVSDHLRHLQFGLEFAFMASLFLAAALAIVVAWQQLWQLNRRRTQADAGPRQWRPWPVRLTMMTVFMLGFGAFMIVNTFSRKDAGVKVGAGFFAFGLILLGGILVYRLRGVSHGRTISQERLDMVDTRCAVEIEASPLRMFGLAALGIVMTALSAKIAQGAFSGPRQGSLVEVFGYAGTVLFGSSTLLILWRAFTTKGPVVTITPEGIRDIRVAAEIIPWSEVEDIRVWEFKGQRTMVLVIPPGVEAALTLTRVARWTRAGNRALGADGLCINAQALKITFDQLLATSLAYARAWRAAAGQYRARQLHPAHEIDQGTSSFLTGSLSAGKSTAARNPAERREPYF